MYFLMVIPKEYVHIKIKNKNNEKYIWKTELKIDHLQIPDLNAPQSYNEASKSTSKLYN